MRKADKKAFMARIEELLTEQIAGLGENLSEIAPHDYAAHMRCEVHEDGSLVYIWKEMPILRVVPEKTSNGTCWRMYTQDERGLSSIQ